MTGEKGFIRLGNDFLQLRQRIETDSFSQADRETVSGLLQRMENFSQLTEPEKTETISLLFEIMLRLGFVMAAESRLKLSSCERIRNEISGAMAAHWLRMFDQGYRVSEGKIIRAGVNEFER